MWLSFCVIPSILSYQKKIKGICSQLKAVTVRIWHINLYTSEILGGGYRCTGGRNFALLSLDFGKV